MPFSPGDTVFYCDSFTHKNPDLQHGARGEVVGNVPGESWIEVRFGGSTVPVACAAEDLRGSPPPLPGGFHLGESVYYTGAGEMWDDGDRLEYGARGQIAGVSDDDHSVEVSFPGNMDIVDCLLTDLSRTWPPVPPTPPPKTTETSMWHEQLANWFLCQCCIA